MVTVAGKAVIRLSKINSQDRIFYTVDGSIPTESSSEWVGGDITVYSHTRFRTLLTTEENKTYRSFPTVYIKIPESGINILAEQQGFTVEVSPDFLNYPNPTIDMYSVIGNLIESYPVTSVSTTIAVPSVGEYDIVFRGDNVFPTEKIRTPLVELLCEPPVINAVVNEDTGEAVITMSKEGEGDIYYTLDGSNPITEGTLYISSFTLVVEGEITIKACTKKAGWNSSEVVSAVVSYYPEYYIAIGSDNFLIGGDGIIIGTGPYEREI